MPLGAWAGRRASPRCPRRRPGSRGHAPFGPSGRPVYSPDRPAQSAAMAPRPCRGRARALPRRRLPAGRVAAQRPRRLPVLRAAFLGEPGPPAPPHRVSAALCPALRPDPAGTGRQRPRRLRPRHAGPLRRRLPRLRALGDRRQGLDLRHLRVARRDGHPDLPLRPAARPHGRRRHLADGAAPLLARVRPHRPGHPAQAVPPGAAPRRRHRPVEGGDDRQRPAAVAAAGAGGRPLRRHRRRRFRGRPAHRSHPCPGIGQVLPAATGGGRVRSRRH